MAAKIFILGLPGSGKSEIARCIKTYVRDLHWLTQQEADYLQSNWLPLAPRERIFNMKDDTNSIEVFFAYAHEDEKLRNQLEKQLSLLKWQGLISCWHDREIGAGIDWVSEINIHLNRA